MLIIQPEKQGISFFFRAKNIFCYVTVHFCAPQFTFTDTKYLYQPRKPLKQVVSWHKNSYLVLTYSVDKKYSCVDPFVETEQSHNEKRTDLFFNFAHYIQSQKEFHVNYTVDLSSTNYLLQYSVEHVIKYNNTVAVLQAWLAKQLSFPF